MLNLLLCYIGTICSYKPPGFPDGLRLSCLAVDICQIRLSCFWLLPDFIGFSVFRVLIKLSYHVSQVSDCPSLNFSIHVQLIHLLFFWLVLQYSCVRRDCSLGSFSFLGWPVQRSARICLSTLFILSCLPKFVCRRNRRKFHSFSMRFY